MKRLIREPLLHFLLLGAGLFALYGALNRRVTAAAPEEILIGPGRIEHLATTFAKVWMRPPTPTELKGLIDQYVKEEVLGREALALGLDRDDTVIRRRLQQKMEFLTADLVPATPPSEAELADWLAEHAADYAREPRTSLRQVFLDPARRGAQLEADVAALLDELRRAGPDADASALGDSLLLPGELVLEPERALAAQFGEEFAAALGALEPGVWGGPVRSGYGAHLVLISERSGGRPATLDEVRGEVERDVAQARREAVGRAYLDGLLAKYTVRIEWPDDAPLADETAALDR